MQFRSGKDHQKALKSKIPVIAFESAIITHGLPYPENVGLIRDLAEITESYAVYQAVFWLDEGQVKIGFDTGELEKLALSSKKVKVSYRDIPYTLANRFTGGTTVAATIFLAHNAGLEVFATGGLGGVHFGAEKSFDISNDLCLLARTPIIVVSSGIKAVLDVPKTLELLETVGVPVYGYQTELLPLFYTRDSDHSVRQVEDTAQIRELYRTHRKIGLTSSLVIANPVPQQWSVPKKELLLTIEEALREAEAKGISGQNVTPFLLDKLSRTDLNTVRTNTELVKNNVRLACEIALELHKHP